MSVENKERFLNSILMLFLTEGAERVETAEFTDLTLKTDNGIYGFITEFDKDKSLILKCIGGACEKCDITYIITDNSAKYREIIKYLPENTGLISYGNDHGLGMIYNILKKGKKAD